MEKAMKQILGERLVMPSFPDLKLARCYRRLEGICSGL